MNADLYFYNEVFEALREKLIHHLQDEERVDIQGFKSLTGMTRKFLDEGGVVYDVIEVDKLEGPEREAAVEEVKNLSGGTSFPVVVIDEAVVVGFNKTRIAELTGL